MSNVTEIWLGHYRLSTEEHGIAIGYADSRENFELLVESYCQSHDVTASHQLAPLPFKTWVQRHGMRGNYWALSERLSQHQPFIFTPYQDVEKLVGTTVQKQSYLIEKSCDIEVLDRQFGTFFSLSVPAILNDSKQGGFFAQMDWYADYAEEAAAPKIDTPDDVSPNYYLVVDAEKSFFFPTLFKSLKNDCLFKGQSYENAADVAPYLVQIEAGKSDSRNFVQNLFTLHESEVHSHWNINPAIFIRSYQDFDKVFTHLRKFTHLLGKNSDGEDKWYFFRFYDPAVLVSYLRGITKHPAHLASFFGTKTGEETRVIDTFGARIDEVFYNFDIQQLPDDTVSAKIELGELEKKVFRNIASAKFLRTQVLPSIESVFGKDTFSHEQLNDWLDEANNLGIHVGQSIIVFITARGYLQQAGLSLEQLTLDIHAEFGELTPDDFADILYDKVTH